jgi:ABC-type antimicrobial peptide transport system permease subunit
MSVFTQILVRTRTSPLAALNRVRAAVKTIDPEQQVVGQVQDLQQWIERTDEYSYGRLVAAIFAGFSIVALALAAIGLFSVVSYGVAQRTNEFGIRMALGATSGTVLKLVMLSTARNVIGGVAIGVALSLLGGRILSSWAEASAQNPLVFAAVTLLLVTTSALATLIPARRVSAVDPMVALRYE